MKIAFVRARYSAHGGAERFAARAVRAVADVKDGAAPLYVAVLARRWDPVALERSDPPVRVVRCDPFYVGSTWRDASFAGAVHAHLAVERFDLVQSHERIVGLPIYRAGDGVHAAWLERRGRTLSGLGRLAIAANPHHRYLVATERAMFEHTALRAVICNSQMVIDEIVARFAIDPAKLVMVRNGVDTTRFHPDSRDVHRHVRRRALGIDDATPVFVLVGSGFERKGVAQAIAAMRSVPEAALVIVGTDKHADRYRRQAVSLGVSKRVWFIGAVDDTLPYLAMADVFVAPTIYDPFPNATLEAWATGLPVITSDASGAAELVEEGVNGWVVGADDDASLVAAMRAAAQRAGTLASAARRTVTHMTLDRLADELAALYCRLLAPGQDIGEC